MIPKRYKQLILSFLVVASLVVMAIPFVSPKSSAISQASFNFCDSLGAGMSGARENVNISDVAAKKAGNRKWTVQELFSNSIGFTSYNGEGDETWYFAKSEGYGKGVPGYDDADVQTKIKEVRTLTKCSVGGFQSSLSNGLLLISSKIVDIARFFTTKMLSGSVICQPGQTGDCINILGVIGGNGSNNGGIIGSLRDSIFSPLATLVFIFVGLWVAYKGLFKREFRASLFGILWAVGIFVLGVIALNKPMMLASAPQKMNSILSTCIVGAMNGQSCLTGTVTVPSTLVGDECKSEASTTGNEGASMAANAMTCSIWKSFVLDAWSRAEFGTGYDKLYLANPPKGADVWKHTPKDTSVYRVNMKSSGSAESYNGGVVETNSEPISNLALYQLYISTNMKSTTDSKYNNKSKDPRWYNIIVPATKDTNMWNYWAPATGYGLKRIMISFSSMIVAAAVSISLILFSLWGMIYMFAGTLLMTFAPFFLLVAIEPGKGRRIFLGWLESVVSSILKYMASSLFVIIALTLYSSILSSTDSYATAFVGVMIMVGVLMMYRKEIVNLLGMTNLGGQKLSNAVGDKLQEKGKKTKEFASYVGGSALGGALAANKMADGVAPIETLKGAMSGATKGARTHMKRGTSMMSGVLRQEEASMRDYKRKQQEIEKAKKKQNDNETSNDSSPDNNDNSNSQSSSNPYKNESKSDKGRSNVDEQLERVRDNAESPNTGEQNDTMSQIKESISRAAETKDSEESSVTSSDSKPSDKTNEVNDSDWSELKEQSQRMANPSESSSSNNQPSINTGKKVTDGKENINNNLQNPRRSNQKPSSNEFSRPERKDINTGDGSQTEMAENLRRDEMINRKDVKLPDEELGNVKVDTTFKDSSSNSSKNIGNNDVSSNNNFSPTQNSVLPDLDSEDISGNAERHVDNLNKTNPSLKRPQSESKVTKTFNKDASLKKDFPDIDKFNK